VGSVLDCDLKPPESDARRLLRVAWEIVRRRGRV